MMCGQVRWILPGMLLATVSQAFLTTQYAQTIPVRPVLRRRPQYHNTRSMVPTRPDDAAHSTRTKENELTPLYMAELFGFLVYSFTIAILVISFEDVTCSYVLPSRHRTSLSIVAPQQWGASTIHGMGFGAKQRGLILPDALSNLPSYNEVMLQHRTKTVPRWKEVPTLESTQTAIHTITSSLETVWRLQAMADDYQWDSIRSQIRESPLQDLPAASAVLRQLEKEEGSGLEQDESIIGFDWGSCAWRHCGAAADAQEALDELDQLLGVLEPFEAVFCLDIVERSLRDIMNVIPWEQASQTDAQFYKDLPVYVSKVSVEESDEEDEATSRIDNAYFKALQELRID